MTPLPVQKVYFKPYDGWVTLERPETTTPDGLPEEHVCIYRITPKRVESLTALLLLVGFNQNKDGEYER